MARAILLSSIVGFFLVIATHPTLAVTSSFFGIQVYEASDADEAFFIKEAENGGVEYTYIEEMVNTSVYAWGTLEDDCLVLDIVNKSEQNLGMDFYVDQYGYYTLDDDIFMLDFMMSEMAYPSLLEAQDSETIVLYLPAPEYIGQIKFIAALIHYGSVAIILKPIQSK